MPIYLNNKSYTLALGNTPIEKMGGDNMVTYSMYGEEPPLVESNIPEVGTVLVELFNDQQNINHDTQIPDVDVDIPVDGKYEVYCIAGGGGSAEHDSSGTATTYRLATGGSGSGFIGIVHLTKGKYTAHIGKLGGSRYYFEPTTEARAYAGGDSYIMKDNEAMITSFGGGGGYRKGSSGTAGAGGALPQINSSINVISTTLNKKGNNGKTGSLYKSSPNSKLNGGASVYNGHGVGTGKQTNSNGVCMAVWGSAGYIKIIYMGK